MDNADAVAFKTLLTTWHLGAEYESARTIYIYIMKFNFFLVFMLRVVFVFCFCFVKRCAFEVDDCKVANANVQCFPVCVYVCVRVCMCVRVEFVVILDLEILDLFFGLTIRTLAVICKPNETQSS